MSIFIAATAALTYFDRDTAVTMVAIAGPESSYIVDARGDLWYFLDPRYHASFRPWSCDDYTAFGLWQVSLPSHHDKITAASGLTAPCDMALWLFDPWNSARIARQIYAESGFGAWSAYNNGAYRSYLDEAKRVVGILAFTVFPGGPIQPVDPPVQAKEPPPAAVTPPLAAVVPP